MTEGLLPTVERATLFTRLDFRSKLALLLVVTLLSLLWESLMLTGLLALGVFLASWAAGIPLGYSRRIVLVFLPFLIILIFTQGFFAGELILARTGASELTPLLRLPAAWPLIGGSVMSVEGVYYAGAIFFKTLSMTMIVPLVVLTTDPNEMVVGLVKLRLPYKIAFILSATLRFFPLLLRRIEAIIQAQRLRGLAIERLGWIRRVRVYAKVAVPLILGAMIESQTLNVVLQSKGFSGSGDRTYFYKSTLTPADYVLMGGSLALLLAAVAAYVALGWGKLGGPI